MKNITNYQAFVENIFKDNDISKRSYYNEFYEKWQKIFKKVFDFPNNYKYENDNAIFKVNYSEFGFNITFNFNQIKIEEWYQNELKRGSKVIFTKVKIKYKNNGLLKYHELPCFYNKDVKELSINNRKIVAAALPAIAPVLQIVYGNKFVEKRIRPFLKHSFWIDLINTDYVPAFLGSDLEVAIYLFLMDYCIIKENLGKVDDKEIVKFLHIMRPSPMLYIKNLINDI